MKHPYFSNSSIICLQSIFSVVEIINELFVICQINTCNFCSYLYNKSNFVYSMYTCSKKYLNYMPFISVDMNIKTMLAVQYLPRRRSVSRVK